MLTASFYEFEKSLLQWEERLRFLARVTPLNFELELQRLAAFYPQAVADFTPQFRYESFEDEALLRRQLELFTQMLEQLREQTQADPLAELVVEALAGRLHEFRVRVDWLSRLRGHRGPGELLAATESQRPYQVDVAQASQVAALATNWLQLASAPEEAERVSLEHGLRRLVQASAIEGLRVEAVELASLAAVSRDCLLVRKDAQVPEGEVRRIFEHEVAGHLLPRRAAARYGPPFRIGTPRADEDEEGRAVLLEERSGLLAPARKRRIAARYLLSAALCEASSSSAAVNEPSAGPSKQSAVPSQQSAAVNEASAAPWEPGAAAYEEEPKISALACLQTLPPAVFEALDAQEYLRALRGGGLGRERVYLDAYVRVRNYVQADFRVLELMGRGRLSARFALSLLDRA